ncbi:hypothetical protein D5R81_00960 [Parashewanella spongiae]|uniref:Uncharacterized protein n=1 Tax=Parashewanella spongiae TaxID=342950 RepID=A0A3A6U1U2_9GAMM|nr:hypothetical protein [Parashewanella spongiae]MCL1078388.1 hypothetical protein [Parashewanella spongiae]RJY19420.1 hypothetical protein D5R81_00960 [Parashewanella spongiae]
MANEVAANTRLQCTYEVIGSGSKSEYHFDSGLLNKIKGELSEQTIEVVFSSTDSQFEVSITATKTDEGVIKFHANMPDPDSDFKCVRPFDKRVVSALQKLDKTHAQIQVEKIHDHLTSKQISLAVRSEKLVDGADNAGLTDMKFFNNIKMKTIALECKSDLTPLETISHGLIERLFACEKTYEQNTLEFRALIKDYKENVKAYLDNIVLTESAASIGSENYESMVKLQGKLNTLFGKNAPS